MLTIDNLQKRKKMGVVNGRRSGVKTGFSQVREIMSITDGKDLVKREELGTDLLE